jgi:outer membrane lipoprotein SlyB
MKKILAAFIMSAMMVTMAIFAAPVSVAAQSYYVKKVRDRYGRTRYVRVAKPSYYRRHRNRINVAAGTGGGALIGALAGGKKGAAIGALIGAGGSALYTYKIKPKKRKYKKVRRY